MDFSDRLSVTACLMSQVKQKLMIAGEVNPVSIVKVCQEMVNEHGKKVSIASSFLDTQWFEKIKIKDGLLFLAGGGYYFEEEQIKTFFVKSADHFKNS